MSSLPQFFKIILQSSLQNRTLMIPKKFISRYGEVLSNPVYLKLPNDEEWKIKLQTSNGLVWFQEGWHEFAEHYSLKHGSLLVFKFDGNSCFQVTIFNQTGLEVEYPKADRKFKDDDSVEILDNFLQQRPKKRKPTTPCDHQPFKKMRMDDSLSPKLEPKEEMHIVKEVGCEEMPDSDRKKPSPAVVKVEGAQRGDGSKFESLSFTVVMPKSYVFGKYALVIPIAFARKHFTHQRANIILQISDGRSWPLIYTWSKSRKYAYIQCGWKEFVNANHLKKGDVGVFELIEKDKLLFTKQTCPSTSQGNGFAADIRENTGNASFSKNLEALGTASEFSSSKPFFKVHLNGESFSSPYLDVPESFGCIHLSENEKECVKLYARGRICDVKLLNCGYVFRFSDGWQTFLNQNGLKEGDTCIFEMISKTSLFFKVSIFNHKDSVKCK